MTSLYTCRHSGDQYRITKLDADWNVESSYLCDLTACECPAGHRPTCRHREMLPKFIQRNHIGDEWLFDYNRGGWVQGAPVEPALASEASIGSMEPSMPPGITMINLDDPALLYNTIANAVGEPRIEPSPIAQRVPAPTPNIRRRV